MKLFVTVSLILLSSLGFSQESYISIRPVEPLLGSVQVQYEMNFDGIAVELCGAAFFSSVLYEGPDIEFSPRENPGGFGAGLMVKFYEGDPWGGSFYHGPKVNVYNMTWRESSVTRYNESSFALLYQIGHTSISAGNFFVDMFGAIGYDPLIVDDGNYLSWPEYPRRYMHNSFSGIAWEVGVKIGLAL